MKALVIGCHPDDIEFMMAGTFLLLGEKGVELNYMNLSNGDLGSNKYNSLEETAGVRKLEAIASTKVCGARYFPSIGHDLLITYDEDSIRKVCAVVREVDPDIILVPALTDYMEDHINTARIAVSAAFAKGMKNFESIPPVKSSCKSVAIYHAMPYGLKDALSRDVRGDFYVDITSVLDTKVKMLACHKSQQEWLDDTQKVNSYLQNMKDMTHTMAIHGGIEGNAEGWIHHNTLGFCEHGFDPLNDILKDYITKK